MGPVTTQFAKIDPGPSQDFGQVSFLITIVGAALVILAFTVINWFQGSTSSSFRNIHKTMNEANAAGIKSEVVAKAYFSWLAWVLLAVVLICALLAAVPTIGGPFRIVGPLSAVAAIALTFVAIKLFKDTTQLDASYRGYTQYLKHARVAFYLAVGGFLLMGVGAVIGPRRDRT
jgi:flagellar biosynthesis protein FlhB